MRTRRLYFWDSLRTSYWFVPMVLNLAAIALAIALITLDHTIRVTGNTKQVWWIYTGGPQGARAVLSTIAGSMITVAGVVFSITIVALSLASGQFGPRLLRNFIRDRNNQVVLGVFTGTFVFCLLALRSVHGVDETEFVPGITVAAGILLALASLGVLIWFIHHVAVSIQANNIIAVVSEEMHQTLNSLWPEALGDEDVDLSEADCEQLPDDFERQGRDVVSRGHGYVAAIDYDSLVKLAKERDVIVRLMRRPGHFTIEGKPLALIWPAEKVDGDLERRLNEAFLLELHRTAYQDIEFTIDQMVEVAVRALSPGINDPFTAVTCLDWLAESLGRLVRRKMPSPYHCDDEHKLRVITRAVSFSDVADAAFNQIRQYGSSSASVMIHMLEAVATVSHVARRPADRAALARHARLIRHACDRSMPEAADRMDVDVRFARVMEVLGASVDVEAADTDCVGMEACSMP